MGSLHACTRRQTHAQTCTHTHTHRHAHTGYTGRVPLHVINAGRAESPPKQGRVTKDACLALPEQELAVERRRRRRGGALAAVWWLRGGWRLPLAASAGCATRTGHCFGPKLTENLGLLVARFWFSAQTVSDCGGRGKREGGLIRKDCIAMHCTASSFFAALPGRRGVTLRRVTVSIYG